MYYSVMKEQEFGSDADSQADGDGTTSVSSGGSSGLASSPLPPKAPLVFSLGVEDNSRAAASAAARDVSTDHKLLTATSNEVPCAPGSFQPSTPTLNPNRPPELLTPEIYDLLCTQMKYIVGLAHKQLIQKTMRAMVESARVTSASLGSGAAGHGIDFGLALWGTPAALSQARAGRTPYCNLASPALELSSIERRRGRSPGRDKNTPRSSSNEPRKQQAHSLSKARSTIAHSESSNAGGAGGVGIADAAGGVSDAAAVGKSGSVDSSEQRRSRSTSVGAHRNASTASRGASGGAAGSNSVRPPRKSSSMNNSLDEYDQAGSGSSITGPGSTLLPQLDHATVSQIKVLRSVPPDVQHRVQQTKGAVHGVWLAEHPMHLQSTMHADLLQIAAESSLPPGKKLEWELDIMREQDEKRMECYAAFLFSRRASASLEPSSDVKKAGAAGGGGGGGKGLTNARPTRVSSNSKNVEYYKDKGRQPMK